MLGLILKLVLMWIIWFFLHRIFENRLKHIGKALITYYWGTFCLIDIEVSFLNHLDNFEFCFFHFGTELMNDHFRSAVKLVGQTLYLLLKNFRVFFSLLIIVIFESLLNFWSLLLYFEDWPLYRFLELFFRSKLLPQWLHFQFWLTKNLVNLNT